MSKLTASPGPSESDVTTLGILSLVYGAQILDQIHLGMFIQPIKAQFALSDTQAWLMTDTALTALVIVLGLPMAPGITI